MASVGQRLKHLVQPTHSAFMHVATTGGFVLHLREIHADAQLGGQVLCQAAPARRAHGDRSGSRRPSAAAAGLQPG